jgi:cystathionine gamma-synthase
MLERCLAALESGSDCAAFGSGQAAAMAVFQALRPGDHLIIPDDAYHGIVRLLRELMVPWGLEYTPVDMADPENVRAAVRPSTRMVWVESPSNPLLKIADIAAIASIAHEAGAFCAVDNTWASPILQRPLELGADVSVHSTTKYLGGHSDVLSGAVIVRESGPFFDRVRFIQSNGGAVPSPFDCWLVLRGIRTLPYRVRAHAEHAMRVAQFLAEQPKIERVNYPGLPSHPGHAIAARQMSAFGGMLSIEVRDGQPAAMAITARLKIFTRATSLGGTESLIEHRASIEGPESKTSPKLLRLSVGLEHPDDLIADLAQALEC